MAMWSRGYTIGQLLYRRGISRYHSNLYEEAIDDLTSALEHVAYPQSLAAIYYTLGVCFANLGKHLFALPAFDEALKRVDPSKFPHFLHERAKSAQIVGEHEAALRDFSK